MSQNKSTGLPVRRSRYPVGSQGTGSWVRKKPCPYCQKKLVATTKGKWRYNLARHLVNTCQPYQRRNIELMTMTICKLLEAFLPAGMTAPGFGSVPGYLQVLNARAEISELERIAKMDAPAIQSPVNQEEDTTGTQGGQNV